MRKKLIIVLAMLMAISVVGCSSVKVNDTNVRAGKAIINAVDAYLDGTADLRTTYNTVETESKTVDENDDMDDALYFRVSVSCLALELNPTFGGNDVSEIKKYRNEIADYIGESQYK